MTYAIGVDLGGTKTAAARVWPDGTIGDVVTARHSRRVSCHGGASTSGMPRFMRMRHPIRSRNRW